MDDPSATSEPRRRNLKLWLSVYAAVLATIATVCLAILAVGHHHTGRRHELHRTEAGGTGPTVPPQGSWRFVVSGDSRNCGDVIMPAIAAHSAQFSPSFYWHLGDLRAIYKIDEDMAFAASNHGQELACADYHQRAWSDFIENQIMPFGHLPFYVGIGNHEVIKPKTEDEFKRQFAEWLDQPTLREQRLKDKEPAQVETYYHWIQGGVDFIYLDNADDSFSPDELTWLKKRLAEARADSAVKSVVVGMHEALPDSRASDHSMGDKKSGPTSAPSGKEAYDDLSNFHDLTAKPVYVLASHSHFYMDNIFDTDKLTDNKKKRALPGWIIGTAGAVRYHFPGDARPDAMTDVYGYLLGTVANDGTIRFSFQEVRESDIPQAVRERYSNAMIPWCFAHNTQSSGVKAPDITALCPAPGAAASSTSH